MVIDARKRRSSEYIELLGHYDPRETVAEPLKINVERAQHWLLQGAQPTDTALRLFERAGVEAGAVSRQAGPRLHRPHRSAGRAKRLIS